ncbi:Dihydrolipoamide succinyltransferase component of 2-oxoglutarate dehydrogenase complex, partial [Pseudomonas syringae pv. aptata]
MAIEIKAPSFPESVADGTISKWYKKEGDAVKRDEMLVDIETDKVVLEVLAEADGVMGAITKEEGAIVLSNEVLGTLNDGATASAAPAPAAAPASASASAPAAAPAASAGEEDPIAAPAARQLAEENGINLASLKGTGKDGRITKEDVVAAVEAKKSAPAAAPAAKPAAAAAPVVAAGDRTEKRVPMTRVRATVAKRLVEAQSNMAMLTTFNEVDMTEVMALRSKYKDLFEKSHNGVRLGFMSFFVKAATEALKRFPAVNASIDGSDIVYHGYADVGVAVS